MQSGWGGAVTGTDFGDNLSARCHPLIWVLDWKHWEYRGVAQGAVKPVPEWWSSFETWTDAELAWESDPGDKEPERGVSLISVISQVHQVWSLISWRPPPPLDDRSDQPTQCSLDPLKRAWEMPPDEDLRPLECSEQPIKLLLYLSECVSRVTDPLFWTNILFSHYYQNIFVEKYHFQTNSGSPREMYNFHPLRYRSWLFCIYLMGLLPGVY